MSRTDYNHVDMYKLFKKMYPDEKITLKQFKAFITGFNQRARQLLLSGEILKLHSWRLGTLSIRRDESYMEEDRMYKRINWVASKKLRQQGVEKWFVYYTDEYYYKFYWTQKQAPIKNRTAYSFIPTKGSLGIKHELAKLLRADPLNALRFKPVPGWQLTKQ